MLASHARPHYAADVTCIIRSLSEMFIFTDMELTFITKGLNIINSQLDCLPNYDLQFSWQVMISMAILTLMETLFELFPFSTTESTTY